MLILFSFSQVQAISETVFFWDNTIRAAVDSKKKEMLIVAEFDVRQAPYNSYIMDFTINGKTYRKTLQYSDKRLYSVIEVHNALLNTSYPYSLSIKTENYKELYTASGTILVKNSSLLTNPDFVIWNTVGTVPNTNTGSNNTPVITANQREANKASALIIANLPSKLTNTQKINELVDDIKSIQLNIFKFPTNKDVFELIINNLEVEIRRLSGVSNPSTPIKPTPSNKSFVPVYKTRASEPNKINGIGNSQKYDSWRGR